MQNIVVCEVTKRRKKRTVSCTAQIHLIKVVHLTVKTFNWKKNIDREWARRSACLLFHCFPTENPIKSWAWRRKKYIFVNSVFVFDSSTVSRCAAFFQYKRDSILTGGRLVQSVISLMQFYYCYDYCVWIARIFAFYTNYLGSKYCRAIISLHTTIVC